MSRRNRLLALLAGLAFALTVASQALAYGHQVPTTITVTPDSSTFLCDHPTGVRATVLDQDGLPIKGLTVTWSFTSSPSSADRILQVTSKTDKDGVAKTIVKLACVAGDRVITATTGGVSGSAVIHVDLDRPGKPNGGVLGVSQGGVLGATSRRLPTTSTVDADAAPTGLPTPIVPIAFAGVVAAALVMRRTLSRR